MTDQLYEAWEQHIEDTPGHTLPASQGGEATFDTNLAYTYIRCSVCGWDYSLDKRSPAERETANWIKVHGGPNYNI